MDFIWNSGLALNTGCAACLPGGVCVVGFFFVCLGA